LKSFIRTVSRYCIASYLVFSWHAHAHLRLVLYRVCVYLVYSTMNVLFNWLI
jgi:hypothetical protein